MTGAAIFDFNGTLFWDTEYHIRAFEIFTKRYQDPSGLRSREITNENWRFNIMGRQNDCIMRYLFGEDLTDSQVKALSEEKEAIYRDLCRGKVVLAPGAEDLFNLLASRQIPFTIASSAEKCNMDFYYEELHLEKWFPYEKIVFNDGSFAGKPAPDIFLLAASRLGVDPSEAVIFEDSKSGVMAAEAAGAGSVIIVDSSPDNSVPDDMKARYPLIRDFRSAIGILGL